MSNDNERKRIRLCTHKDVDDEVHEMLIVHAKDTYVRPHKHVNKIESFHVIEGKVDIVLFKEDGGIMDAVQMGDYLSGYDFYHRISFPYYHTLIIRSDVLVFHETTNGPFKRTDTIFPVWAPDEKDFSGQKEFMSNLIMQVDSFVSENKKER
jgi:cupin fold WbuC family metalloprotein